MSVTHRTYIEIVNDIATAEGYGEIEAADFNDDDALQRPHKQIKLFVNIANAQLFTTMDKCFSKRHYEFTSVDGTGSYSADDETDIESIEYHSLRCVSSSNQRRLQFLDYNEEWMPKYPDPDDIDEGKPLWWTYKVTPGGQIDVANKILLAPIPDAAYEFQYRGKVVHTPLSAATDKILWPPKYEHVLFHFAREMFATRAGDSRQQLSYYATEAVGSCKMWSTTTPDHRKRIRMAYQIEDGVKYDRWWDL